jgi:tRNA pseudouridine55 synthase
MDGLLVVDKPVGPTSHDVVARVRRALGERRIGHTGTLDPAASGVLALVLGRATRLARFMAGDRKHYDAVVRLGVATDTYDAEGKPSGVPYDGAWPAAATLEAVLEEFRGSYLQQPPAYSAKKIDGRRSYDIARRQDKLEGVTPLLPSPVTVSVAALTLTGYRDGLVTLTLECSAGFYVRSLAHDLGQRLGTGAHLAGLRRTRSGAASLDEARTLESIEADPQSATQAMVPMANMLPSMPAVTLTDGGATRARHGCSLGPADCVAAAQRELVLSGPGQLSVDGADRATTDTPSELPREPNGSALTPVRLLTSDGRLLGIAEAKGGSRVLHPCVVLV